MDKNGVLQKMKPLGLLILCSVLCLSGCSSVIPRARISNVMDETVAQALWETGSKGHETTANDFVGAAFNGNMSGRAKSIWPSSEEINKPHTVIQYDLQSVLASWKCRDTIQIIPENENNTILSIKCENKYVPFLNVISLVSNPIISVSPFYDRDYDREETLMLGTVQRLQKDRDVSIEWIGAWRPVQPIVITQNGVKWIAFTGTDAQMAVDYFVQKGYERIDPSTSTRLLFGRYLTKDPWEIGYSIKAIAKKEEGRIVQRTERQTDSEQPKIATEQRGNETIYYTIRQWESKEKILVKTVNTVDGPHEKIVIIGIAGMGYGYQSLPVRRFFFGGFKHEIKITNAGDNLVNTVLGDLRKLAYDYTRSKNYSQVIEFINPSPWIEDLAVEPLQSEFIQKMKRESK